MRDEDVVIGMKVTPHEKSVWRRNKDFNWWLERDLGEDSPSAMLKKNGYLVVEEVQEGEYGANGETVYSLEGDFFIASDFEPYVEPIEQKLFVVYYNYSDCDGGNSDLVKAGSKEKAEEIFKRYSYLTYISIDEESINAVELDQVQVITEEWVDKYEQSREK